MTRGFDVFFDLRLKNAWVNNRDAGDLRRHRSHYDATVMTDRELDLDMELILHKWTKRYVVCCEGLLWLDTEPFTYILPV